MKLTWKDIEPFVKKPNPKARAILVYGPDSGLVKERAAAMGLSVVSDLNDPFNVAVLSGDGLTDDPARLQDEAMAMSMMGGGRLIRVENGSDKLTLLFKEYLAGPSGENLVIVEAGELGPKSSLRLLFEKSESAAAIPCYVDDERNVSMLVKQTLSENGYTIQSDALSWFAMNVAGDRMRVRTEIDKLMLYMGKGSKNITAPDVMAICGEAGAQSIDDLILAIGAGKTEMALFTYNKLLAEGVFVVQILRFLQNHFRRLHFTKSQVSGGTDIDDAMKKLQPPVFFKNADSFKAQVRKSSETRLLTILNRLSQVEAQMKQTGAPVETLGSQVVLSLAAQG
jgi:DNA polymerase-3 subunit delta